MRHGPEPRILISRLSHIGDCILAMPILCALRDRFPRAHIAWVIERSSAPLLETHPALDELIVVPRGWLRSFTTVRALRRRLSAGKFDIAIDPQSLTKSAIVARLSAARLRIGFAGAEGRELSRMLNNRLVRRRLNHMVDRGLDLLRPLGIRSPRVRFDVPTDAAAERSIADFLAGRVGAQPFTVINPGAGWDSKIWPAQRYADVARHLGERNKVPSVVVWAGDRERGWGEVIVARSGGHAELAPPTTLPELAALLRRASLFVGSDTGPMHLAAAVDTPCVALFGPTRPKICGPYGDAHVVLQEYYQSGSHRQRRRAENLAMKAIRPERVWSACKKLLLKTETKTYRNVA